MTPATSASTRAGSSWPAAATSPRRPRTFRVPPGPRRAARPSTTTTSHQSASRPSATPPSDSTTGRSRTCTARGVLSLSQMSFPGVAPSRSRGGGGGGGGESRARHKMFYFLGQCLMMNEPPPLSRRQLMGWALDGFGIYSYQDVGGAAPVVDECGGHFGPVDTGAVEYHYHSRQIVPYHLACQESDSHLFIEMKVGNGKSVCTCSTCRGRRSAAAPRPSRGQTTATQAAGRTTACSPAPVRASCETTSRSGTRGGTAGSPSTTSDSGLLHSVIRCQYKVVNSSFE